MAFVSVGLFASAAAPDYTAVMVLRIVTLMVGAVFHANGRKHDRDDCSGEGSSGRFSFVFLGWALALAAGLPLVTFVATHFGWRAVYVVLGVMGMLTTALLLFSRACETARAAAVAPHWGEIARNRYVCWLLLITVLWTCGQFVLLPMSGRWYGSASLAGGGP